MEAIAPAEGKRRALHAYVPQYKVAAEKVLSELLGGRLEANRRAMGPGRLLVDGDVPALGGGA